MKYIAHNPDVKKLYHVWHVCEFCGQVWTHSQADWEVMKNHKHDYVVSIPIEIPDHVTLVNVNSQ